MSSRANASNKYYSGPKSDHFDGRIFFNPDGQPPGKLSDLLKWQFGGGKQKWPSSAPSPFHGAKPAKRVQSLTVTMIGHASLLIQLDGINILTDPVWSDRVSPVRFAGPKRANPPGVAFDDLPPIDLVLVTHNHYDHLDTATLARLFEIHKPRIVTPLGNDIVIRKSVPDADVVIGDWGDVVAFNEQIRLHFEPCHHWSARGTADRRMALWAAFVIETGAQKIYHIGDTGFHDGINYRAAKEKHGSFDLAVLPIGAYEPRWFMSAQHQNPDEAVQGMKLCGAKRALGHHWGTFQLTNEAINDPKIALEAALKARGLTPEAFKALQPGQSWTNS